MRILDLNRRLLISKAYNNQAQRNFVRWLKPLSRHIHMSKFALIAIAIVTFLAAGLTFGAASTSAILYACHPDCWNCDLVLMLSRRYAEVFGGEPNLSGLVM